jgi:hypothetical protein
MLNSPVIPANHICRKNLLPWHEVVNVNMPEQPRITAEIREKTMKASPRFKGDVRPALDLLWTDEEYEHPRSEVFGTPLP